MRASEDHWNGPNNCATIQFTPASGSHPLRVGDTGSVSANLVSSRGGSPSGATWTHTGRGQRELTPPTASSVPASFNYSGITAAGEGIFVTGSWKAVSKAGVAQETWTQPTVSSAINTISGTFSGDQNIGGSILNWVGEATFVRVLHGEAANGAFTLQSASYTVTASGRALHINCQQSGSKTITQTAGDLSSLGQPPRLATPVRPQRLDHPDRADQQHDDRAALELLGPGELAELDGHQPRVLRRSRSAVQSADGLDFSGNLTDTLGAVTNWHWSMRGAP